MFQTFETEGDRTLGAERVAQLRAWLSANELDGFIVPRSDEHQGEYVAPRSERVNGNLHAAAPENDVSNARHKQ